MKTYKPILDACCGGKMFYFDKNDSRVLFQDIRDVETTLCDGNTYLGSRLGCSSSMGYCMMFDENHRSWRELPRRCQKLFNKAFRMPEGSHLVIVRKEEEQ